MSDDLLNANALPPFAALRAFEAVFRTGGIRKAANSLNLNHAVVSRHLRNLEDWLGAPLLNHSGNRLTLTDAGAQFHARVSTAIVELALATNEVMGRQKRSPLKVWCIPGLSIQWLSGQLADFERDHAEYVIELKPTDTAPNFSIHEADADIRYFRDDNQPGSESRGLKHIELARPDVMPVACPALAKKLNGEASIDALLNAPLLHEEVRDEWRAWLTLNGHNLKGEPPGQLYWHAHLALAAAKRGRGVALANIFLVEEDLAKGDLVEVVVPGTKRIPLGNYMLTAREDRWSTPALAALRRFLTARAKRKGN